MKKTKDIIDVIHQKDLIDFLTNLDLYENFTHKQILCKFCNEPITRENICAIFYTETKIEFVCDKELCYDKILIFQEEKKNV